MRRAGDARAMHVRHARGAHAVRAHGLRNVRVPHSGGARAHASAVRVWLARTVLVVLTQTLRQKCVCRYVLFFPNLICLSKYGAFSKSVVRFHAQLRTQPLAYELNIARVA